MTAGRDAELSYEAFAPAYDDFTAHHDYCLYPVSYGIARQERATFPPRRRWGFCRRRGSSASTCSATATTQSRTSHSTNWLTRRPSSSPDRRRKGGNEDQEGRRGADDFHQQERLGGEMTIKKAVVVPSIAVHKFG